MAGSQDFAVDPRNADLRIYLNGALVPRAEAKVSIFDAGFVLGDGVWEGLRLHKGRLLFLNAHLDRLFDGLKAIALDIGLPALPTLESFWPGPNAAALEHLRLSAGGESASATRSPFFRPCAASSAATWVVARAKASKLTRSSS